MEVINIAGVLLGLLIGTSFVYDLFYSRIPNVIIGIGFLLWFPYIVVTRPCNEVVWALLSIVLIGSAMFLVYMVRGIGAGDVKLISLIAGFLSPSEGVKLVFLIFLIGAFAGIIKIILRILTGIAGGGLIKGNTGIRFTGPILTGYLLMLLSRGGI